MMTNITDLKKQLEEAEQRVKAEQERLFENPKLQYFAENLHQSFCNKNHDGGWCNWEWENGKPNVWAESSHRRWLEKAVDLVAEFPRVDYADIIALLREGQAFK